MASNVDRSDEDRFDYSGPTHMMGAQFSATRIDWDDKEQCRCITACIVKATYVLENDRIMCRVQDKALAPAWSETFNFELVDVLKDDACSLHGDKFIFGAIYKQKQQEPLARRHRSAPHYIIAFRGTMLRHPKAIQDIWLDGRILINDLMYSKRSQRAHQAVETLLADLTNLDCVIWLAGHSLGASLALEVGRTMVVEKDLKLPTFLFNPPHASSAPVINLLQPTEVGRKDMHFTKSCVKAGLGWFFPAHRERMEKRFEKMSSWELKLFVHDKDPICQGYIDYFEQRPQLEERSHGVAKSAAILSCRDMVRSILGSETQRPHLLPSAELCKNSSMNNNNEEEKEHWFKQSKGAHKLEQWWKPDGELNLSVKNYKYPWST